MRRILATFAFVVAAGGATAQDTGPSYAEVSAYTCAVLPKIYGTQRYAEVIDPAINYIMERGPVTEQLGSACNIGDYIKAECRGKPRRTIGEAVDSLIDKVSRRAPLPKIPNCGA